MRLLVWNKGAVRTAGQLAFLTLLAAMTVQPASAQDGSGSKASCFKIVSVAETQRQTIRLNSCTGESWLLSRTANAEHNGNEGTTYRWLPLGNDGREKVVSN